MAWEISEKVLRTTWERPENNLRKSWESCWKTFKFLRKSSESPKKVLTVSADNILRKSLENSEKVQKKSEKVQNKSWESPWKVLGTSWESAEKGLGKSWESLLTWTFLISEYNKQPNKQLTNHPNREPSRFLLLDWEVKGNQEVGKYVMVTFLNKRIYAQVPWWPTNPLIMPNTDTNCCKILQTCFFLSTVTAVTVVTTVTTF